MLEPASLCTATHFLTIMNNYAGNYESYEAPQS